MYVSYCIALLHTWSLCIIQCHLHYTPQPSMQLHVTIMVCMNRYDIHYYESITMYSYIHISI